LRPERTLPRGQIQSAGVGGVLTFTGDLSSILVPMIKAKLLRYQTFIERSITAGGFGTEKYYAIAASMTMRDSCRGLLTLNVGGLAQIATPTSSYICTTRAHSAADP